MNSSNIKRISSFPKILIIAGSLHLEQSLIIPNIETTPYSYRYYLHSENVLIQLKYHWYLNPLLDL
jgi:hypothetical protein